MLFIKSRFFLIVFILLASFLLLSVNALSKAEQSELPESLSNHVSSHESDSDELTKDQAKLFSGALFDGDLEAVREMIKNGMSLNEEQWREIGFRYPVVSAATYPCNVEMLELLKAGGAMIDYVQKYEKSTKGIISIVLQSMYVAVYEDKKNTGYTKKRWVQNTRYDYNFQCVRWLLEQGADPNGIYYIPKRLSRDGSLIESSVSMAVKANDLKMLDLLYEYGADINAPRQGNSNPLDIAIVKKHYEAVRWLLDHGVDIYNKDENGYPAVRGGDIKIKTWFLEMGVDPEKYNYQIDAVRYGDLEFLEKIFSVKPLIDINYIYDRKERKKVPSEILTWASKASGYEHIVKRLLELSADPCLINSKGRTAYEEARKFKREKNLAILEAHYPESACIKQSDKEEFNQ